MNLRSDHNAAVAVARLSPSRVLLFTAWISALIFGVYIVVFYGGALLTGSLQDWNQVLPHVYEEGTTLATWAIGAHFVAGAVVLFLGPLQLLPGLRARSPSVHRAVGRIYALASLGAGLGGLAYLVLKGAVGGLVMDAGFGGYGVLVVLAAVNTVRHARGRRFELHRAWAIRLFALGIGSWLYRMDYGIWLKLVGGIGHHSRIFDGPFDYIMDFAFYVPNLIIAEWVIRTQGRRMSVHAPNRPLRIVLVVAICMVAVSTFLFTRSYWGPHIVERFATLRGII
jgi:Predicted membrane protein (DUF2306)